MFKFLRKHQKYFFYVITTIIIITFSFFGTYSTIEKAHKKQKDRPAAITLDGKVIKEGEMSAFSLFLATEGDTKHPNLLNDGVIHKDFIKTKLAKVIATEYLSELKEDLQNKIEKIQKYTPYVHNQVPFISAKTIWSHFCPELESNLNKIQKKKSIDPEFYEALFALYDAQASFPSESLKKILYYQQRQYDWIIPDDRILQDDFALFGFASAGEWFGQNFIDIISQFIINTSLIAEKKGYRVSEAEARSDLMQNLKNALKNSKYKSGIDFFSASLRSLGMNETEAVEIWRKILLFRKYVQDVGNTVFLDSMCHKEILTFANEKANLMVYELPQSLKLNSFDDFLKLQMYLKAVALPSEKIQIPSGFKSLCDIEGVYPELIEKPYVLKIRHVHVQDLALKIGEKELWAWQLADENWQQLTGEFAALRASNINNKEERFAFLQGLNKPLRQEVDNFSRNKMLEFSKESIIKELCSAEEKEMKINVRLKGWATTLKVDFEKFLPLLENAKELTPDSLLYCYSDNKEDFYQVKVVSKEDKKIVSFSDAKKDGILEDLLDKELKLKYSNLPKDERFKNENGPKPFLEVKDTVGAIYFADVLKKIDLEEAFKEKDKSLQAYPFKFLYLHMKNMKKEIENGKDIIGEWAPTVKKVTVTRAMADEKMKKEIFAKAEPSTWSDLNMDDKDVSFYKFLNKEKDEKTNIKEMEKAKELLSLEAKLILTKKILEELKSKKIIKISQRKIDV